MKIGLFLGSFDPIHIGHISIISSVLNAGFVDKVIVIPAWHNPFKEHSPASFYEKVVNVLSIIERHSKCSMFSDRKHTTR